MGYGWFSSVTPRTRRGWRLCVRPHVQGWMTSLLTATARSAMAKLCAAIWPIVPPRLSADRGGDSPPLVAATVAGGRSRPRRNRTLDGQQVGAAQAAECRTLLASSIARLERGPAINGVR